MDPCSDPWHERHIQQFGSGGSFGGASFQLLTRMLLLSTVELLSIRKQRVGVTVILLAACILLSTIADWEQAHRLLLFHSNSSGTVAVTHTTNSNIVLNKAKDDDDDSTGSSAAPIIGSAVSSLIGGDSPSPHSPYFSMRILEQYQQWHGVDALRKESGSYTAGGNDSNNRFYAIAYLPRCIRDGDVLHNLFNSILWAVITNRIILVRYDDGDGDDCNNNENDDTALRLAPWLPKWEEDVEEIMGVDNSLLLLCDAVPIPIDYQRLSYDRRHKVVTYPQIRSIQSSNTAGIFRNVWTNHPLSTEGSKRVRTYNLHASCNNNCFLRHY